MKLKNAILFLLFLFFAVAQGFAQQDSLEIIKKGKVKVPEELGYKPYDPLAPARAAFYSAILPGLGQAYNGKYWKIPIIYGALGVGVYFYINNDRQYDRYRDAYKSRLAGQMDDEFIDEDGEPILTREGLIDAQKFYQRNKEISILVIAGIYALNIIDANVDAHLAQFNVSEDLSLKPTLNMDRYTGKTEYRLSLNYKF
ncbi:MAG TPA: DUF5683 domain-containing protein [Salinimicrobium sp.]|nr:DUF5683 domain-containing protein [Salinimicrobium sp.]